MNKLVVERVEPYSPGDDSASITLRYVVLLDKSLRFAIRAH